MSGSSSIKFTYQTAIGGASALSYTVDNFTAYGSSTNSSIAEAVVTLNFTGASQYIGHIQRCDRLHSRLRQSRRYLADRTGELRTT